MSTGPFPTSSFSVKRTGEFRRLSFNFINLLKAGETISDATFTAEVISGIDGNPNALISGAATIIGSVCEQLIVGGVDGVMYLLKCLINTNLGQRLEAIALLPVSNDVQD